MRFVLPTGFVLPDETVAKVADGADESDAVSPAGLVVTRTDIIRPVRDGASGALTAIPITPSGVITEIPVSALIAVTSTLPDLGRGDVWDHDIELLMTEAARDLSVLRVELWSVDAQGPATAEIELRRYIPPTEAAVKAAAGGELVSADGRRAGARPVRRRAD